MIGPNCISQMGTQDNLRKKKKRVKKHNNIYKLPGI